MDQNPEQNNFERKEELRQNLVLIAQTFFSQEFDVATLEGKEGLELQVALQEAFDKNVRDFYERSELAKEIAKLDLVDSDRDQKAVDIVAKYNSGSELRDPEGAFLIEKELPNFNQAWQKREGKNPAANCTLAGAEMHLALEQVGYQNVHSVLIKGHYLALRELEDGTVRLYDPSTTHDEYLGFIHTCEPDQIKKGELDERGGCVIDIKLPTQPNHTDMFAEENNFIQRLYALPTSVLVDFFVALENLSEFKDHANRESIDLCEKYPILKTLNIKEMKDAMSFSNPIDNVQLHP